MDSDARPEKHVEGVMPEPHLTVGVRADTDHILILWQSSPGIDGETLFGFLRGNILESDNYINLIFEIVFKHFNIICLFSDTW